MKRLAPLIALAPAPVFAHGTHAPVPDALHAQAHVMPALAAVLILAVFGYALFQRWRS